MYNNDNNKSVFPNQGNYPKNPNLNQNQNNNQWNKNAIPKQDLPKSSIPKDPNTSSYKK